MSVFLHGLLRVVIPLFAASSMGAVGLGFDFLHVTTPLRRPAMVVTALLANFNGGGLVARRVRGPLPGGVAPASYEDGVTP